MFAYPKQAEVNRPVPKTKIYAHAKPSKRVKELFTKQVGEIIWRYKLAPETTNVPARDGIHEIQVFEIAAKTEEVDDGVLESINKAIPFPLLFRLTHDEHIQFATAFKRPSDVDASKWVIEASFRTKPQPKTFAPTSLPVALDLASLYEQIVRHHMPLRARAGESIRDQVARFILIEAKQRQLEQLQDQLGKEKQFNRKVEINAAVRSLTTEIEELTRI